MKINIVAEVPTKEEGVNITLRTTDEKNVVVISVESVKLAIELGELEKAIARLKELEHFCY